MADAFRAGVFRAARRRPGVLVAALVGLVTLLAGCGQPTQRFPQETVGAAARVGDIAIRDAVFNYRGPIEEGTVYRPGGIVGVQATIVNEGAATDRLVSVRSPIAGGGVILGAGTIPGGHTLTAGYTEFIASAALPDTTRIALWLTDLNTAIRAGLTYPVLFTFARAGEVRLELWVDEPDEPRADCPLPPNGKAPKILTAPLGGASAPPTNPPPDCSSVPTSIPEVQLLDVEDPLVHPTWASEPNLLLGFVEEDARRLVQVDPETGKTIRSREVEGAGENFALIDQPDSRVALPLTEPDRVALLDGETLDEADSLAAGPRPSWVAVEETAKALFALSEDGSTVTGVDYDKKEEIFRREVQGGPEAAVEPGDDVDPSFWLVSPDGATYFRGEERPEPESDRRVKVSHKTFSSDDNATKSAYFAEEGSRRVELLEGDARGGLELAASKELSETIEHVEAKPEEEYRVYAVTANKLISMKYDTLEVIKTTEFRSALEQAGLDDARISDFTVGDDYLYLAVGGEPLVLKIRKEEALTE